MLQILDFSAGYGHEIILRDIHLEAHKGEIHGVLGINGAGKTTFFKGICRQGPKTSGQIIWKNQPLVPANVGYLPAEPYFYPFQTGKEYLELCGYRNPEFKFEKWNELFQLPLNQLTDTYSTGMRKKLALLGILAGGYEVLLLDEPFSGLDLESTEVLCEILAALKEAGICILLSSHILEIVQRVSDEVSYLSAGRIQKRFARADFPELESFIRNNIKSRTAAIWAQIKSGQ